MIKKVQNEFLCKITFYSNFRKEGVLERVVENLILDLKISERICSVIPGVKPAI